MGEGMSGPGSAECSGPRRKKGKEMVTTMVKTMTTTMKMPQAAVLVLRLKQWRSSASATGRVTGRILGDVLPVLRRAPEVFDDGNASAFANKVVQTWMAFARCLEGAKTPLVPTTANTLHVDCSTLATLLLARAGTGPPQPPAGVNGRVLDLRAAAAASSQTTGTFKEKAFGYRGVARRKRRWEA